MCNLKKAPHCGAFEFGACGAGLALRSSMKNAPVQGHVKNRLAPVVKNGFASRGEKCPAGMVKNTPAGRVLYREAIGEINGDRQVTSFELEVIILKIKGSIKWKKEK